MVRCLPDKKNLTASPAISTVRTAPKTCQGQPPRMYSECSRFHTDVLILTSVSKHFHASFKFTASCHFVNDYKSLFCNFDQQQLMFLHLSTHSPQTRRLPSEFIICHGSGLNYKTEGVCYTSAASQNMHVLLYLLSSNWSTY